MTIDLKIIKKIIENDTVTEIKKLDLESREEIIFNTLANFFRQSIGESNEYLLSIFDERIGPRTIKFTKKGFKELTITFELPDKIFVTPLIETKKTNGNLFILNKKEVKGKNPKNLLKKLQNKPSIEVTLNKKSCNFESEHDLSDYQEFLTNDFFDVHQLFIQQKNKEEFFILRRISEDYKKIGVEEDLENKFFTIKEINSKLISYRGTRMLTLIKICKDINEKHFKDIKEKAKELQKRYEKNIKNSELIRNKIENVTKYLIESTKGESITGLKKEELTQVGELLATLL